MGFLKLSDRKLAALTCLSEPNLLNPRFHKILLLDGHGKRSK
jgi:hypothetical protein